MKLRPERRNAVKVLLFLDVGGSMDWHIETAEELFSAARLEFKHFEHFYFHNCLYESVWKDNRRRHDEGVPTLDLIRTYPSDYRVVFVGDASMSPYEIADSGRLGRALERGARPGLDRAAPQSFPQGRLAESGAEEPWSYTQSIGIMRHLSRPHVPADPRRPRRRDAGIGEVNSAGRSLRAPDRDG